VYEYLTRRLLSVRNRNKKHLFIKFVPHRSLFHVSFRIGINIGTVLNWCNLKCLGKEMVRQLFVIFVIFKLPLYIVLNYKFLSRLASNAYEYTKRFLTASEIPLFLLVDRFPPDVHAKLLKIRELVTN
jgi:hypothetical protein